MTAHDPALIGRIAHAIDEDAPAAALADADRILDLLDAEGRIKRPDETRVLLVKPGDTLLIGGIGGAAIKKINVDDVAAWFNHLRIKCVLFAEDIDIATLPQNRACT